MKPLALASLLLAGAALAQGPLDPPPGPPAPSMKTLDQVEARIPITAATAPGSSEAVHVISSPGSYYLTGNVQGVSGKDGILIESSDVTLDLNGYQLAGVAGSLNGISLSRSDTPLARLWLKNGTITGFGGRGIYTVGFGSIHGLKIEDLTIDCTGDAIRADVGHSSVVRRVFVRGGTGGIKCTGSNGLKRVEGCSITNITGEAIVADDVADCQVTSITLNGFVVISATRVSNCLVSRITGTSGMVGISAQQVTGCVVTEMNNAGTLPVDGVQADVVSDTRVNQLTGAGGKVRGIAQVNTSTNGTVTGCSVSNLRTTGSGVVSGIESGTVGNCQVTKIGYQDSTGEVTGILASSRIQDCGIKDIGHANVTGTVTGAKGGSTSAGSVSHVDVATVTGNFVCRGVDAALVDHANVKGLRQQGSGTGQIVGISAERVIDSQVRDSIANGTIECHGIFATSAQSCSVGQLTNPGSGVHTGITSPKARDCTVQQVDGDGIAAAGGRARITGCSVETCIQTGINCGSPGGILDGNVVAGCELGIRTYSGSKVVARGNDVTTCTTKYQFDPATRAGPVVTAAGTIASTSPFANFSD